MTQEERKASAKALQAERQQRTKACAQAMREQFAAIPAKGETYAPVFERILLPMRDGVLLDTHIYRPEGLERYPVLIQRSCYPDQMEVYEVYGRELPRRGYGYIVQFCRGSGASGGKWEPNVNERSDGIDTLQWLNDQPWAESIGYFGNSYLALTGWAVADCLPEKVKGMYLTVYGTDRFTSAYEKGLFRHDVLTGWSMRNAGHPVDADYIESCLYRPHAKVDEALWGGRLDWYQDWTHATRRSDAYWHTGWWKLLADIPAKVKVPLYIVDSWYDHHFGSAMIAYQALSAQTRAHSWLDIGSWNHFGLPCVAWDEQKNLQSSDVPRVLEWFDLLLKQKKQPQARIRSYIMRQDSWKTLPCWPAPMCGVKKMYLAEGGKLTDAPQAEGARSFRYDPENPCPTHGAESMLTTLKAAGSLLQPPVDYRPDVISFVSEPLQQPLTICGKPKVRLCISTDAEDTAFTAKLCEVFPDGSAYNIRSGITTLAADREGDAPYVPGEKAQVCVDLWDIAWTLQPGSRLRLDISSSDFPQYAVHSNYPGIWADQETVRCAWQTVYTGSGQSCVELPFA